MGINLAERGYNDVNAATPGEFSQLPAGGYVCRIINAEITKSKAGNEMLVLFIDVAQGDFAGYFKAEYDRVKNFTPNRWVNSGTYRQLLFDNAGRVSSFFKGLMTCFEKSNPNFKLNINIFEAETLRGKLIGFVFAEDEYQKQNGDVGTRISAKFPKTVEDIQIGNFKVPDKKKLQPAKSDSSGDIFAGTPVTQDDLPF